MAEDERESQRSFSGTRKRAQTTTSSFGVSKREGHDASQYYNSKMNKGLVAARDVGPAQTFPASLENSIHCHDSRHLDFIPDNCVDLVVTSPPYNVTKDYDDDLSLEQYLTLLHDVFAECYRVLIPGGRMIINVANIGRKPYVPLTSYINLSMIELGFLMRGEVIWDKSASAGSSCAWGSFQSASNPCLRDIHEYLLIFSKGDYKKSRHHSSTQSQENTISKEEFIQFTKSIWAFQTERASKVNHPAPFPVELPRRCIELYSYEGDVILDPFLGSGSTAIAATLTKRRYIGIDISNEYCEVARKRITESSPIPPVMEAEQSE